MISLHGSVLFADVSGFTKLTARLQETIGGARGAEELNNILSKYFNILITCFHRHGGDVVSFSGDAMTVLFEAQRGADGAPATEEALAEAALRSVRCAVEVLDKVKGFSLAEYAQYGLADCTITLHAGMGVGELTALYVAGYKKPGGEGKLLPSGQVLGGMPERDGFAMMGSPMTQLKHAEEKAGSGECVLSPQLWALVKPHCTAAKEDADGFVFVAHVMTPPAAWADGAPPRTLRDQALNAPQLAACLRHISAFNPEPVQHRLKVAGKNWLADFRVVSIMFMRIKTVSHDTPNVLEECAKCFRLMHETLHQYSGMMARFNVDDKGTIMFAAFGPPFQHEDDAARAVRCGLDIVAKIEKIGHTVRVGITTGNVFCGSVGNEHRCEYTFYGTTVNMAARLMVNGANEGVLVDEQTYRDAKESGVRTIEPLPPIKVKGRDDKMLVYRPHSDAAWKKLMEEKKARGERLGDSAGAGNTSAKKLTTSVEASGRRLEKKKLQERVKALEKDKKGGFVLVEGAAGMGKTALLKDLEKLSMAFNIRVLKGSCSAIDESTPHHVFNFVVSQLLEDGADKLISGGASQLGNTLTIGGSKSNALKEDNDYFRALGAGGGKSGGGSGALGSGGQGSSSGSKAGNSQGAFLSTMADVKDAKAKGVQQLLAGLSGADENYTRYMPLLAPMLGQETSHSRFTAGLTAEKRQEKLLGLCVQLLRAKCKMHSTMLLLDNVQWMDEVSWQLVRKLSTELKELLIVACIRSGDAGSGMMGSGGREAGGGTGGVTGQRTSMQMVSRRTSQRREGGKQAQMAFLKQHEKEHPDSFVRLEPLQDADLKDMAQKLLEVKTVPPALSAFLLKKSEGNPFYVIEIMTFLKRKGDVGPSADSSTIEIRNKKFESDFDSQFESTGLHRLLVSQVESINAKNPQDKANLEQVLRSASALGESFKSHEIRDIHTKLTLQPAASKVDANLSKLRELKLFEYYSEQLAYSFRSSIMRNVIYTSLTFQNRKMLHTAAAELLLDANKKSNSSSATATSSSMTASTSTTTNAKRDSGGPTQYLKAMWHLRAAENDPKALELVTDAVQQALNGTSWNEALDLLEFGDELLNGDHDAEMVEAVAKLPAGTSVVWEEMRGEALLGLQEDDTRLLAYSTFKKAFMQGMEDAGISLIEVAKEKAPKRSIIGKMFGGRKKKSDAGDELDDEKVRGTLAALKAHATLVRALMEAAAEEGSEVASTLTALDRWRVGEHLRASVAAAAAIPTLCAEAVATQAYGAIYLALQLRRDAAGVDAAQLKAAKPQLEPLLKTLVEFVGAQGEKVSDSVLRATSGGSAGGGSDRRGSTAPQSARRPSSSGLGSAALGENGGGSLTARGTSAVSAVSSAGGTSSSNDTAHGEDLSALELSNPSLLAACHLALGLSPTLLAPSDSTQLLKRAAELAAEAEDQRMGKICEHVTKLAAGVKKI